MLVLRSIELLLVLLAFDRFELRAHIVVVDLEFEDLLITDRIGDHIRVKLPPEDAGRCLRAECILREDRGAGEAKLVVVFKFLRQVLLRLAELAAVRFVEDKDHLLVIDLQRTLALHQVVQLLDRGHDDLSILLIQIALQPGRAVRAVHTVGAELLVFLHRLVVQVLAVDYEEDLVDILELGCQTRRLEAGQRLARSSRVPDVAATLGLAPALGFIRAVDLLQDALRGCDLVGAHDEQGITHVEHRIL